jgi:hypothetical protein
MRTRSDGRLFERTANIGFQGDHFELKFATGAAALKMLRKLARCNVRLGADEPTRRFAIHGDSSLPEASAAGVMP